MNTVLAKSDDARSIRLVAVSLVLITTTVPAGAEEATRLEEITVTGTREERPKAETPATVDTVTREDIVDTRPTHPSEVMNHVPGVWVDTTSGEGHLTAIRQPLTTNAVYLYLEDGVPTRSTGFFNHNALYEINVPQAGGIEVIKGPGTVLHGSDAIGGVINVLTQPPPLEPRIRASVETGEFGWRRALLHGGSTRKDDGWGGALNLTHTDGWRDATGYDRIGTTVRWDHAIGANSTAKTVLAYSRIDQQTAGSSTLSREDYLNDPTMNYAPISFRDVTAFRLSSAYEKEYGDALVSLTPYLRHNDMDILPNWSLSYDPVIYSTHNNSVGILAKYRRNFAPFRARLIAGVDIDHSPGGHEEQRITPTKAGKIYTSYTEGETIYDYDVTFQAVSPYVHGELSPTARWRLSAGVRYDAMHYDYDNRLTALATGRWKRPADTEINYRHLSPKLGATYAIAPKHNLFIAYSHGFRVPSENQLFRQGSAVNTVDLEPIKADNYEAGIRGRTGAASHYEFSLYHLRKRDDILSFLNPVTGLRESVNAGETLHRGLEAGFATPLAPGLNLDIAYSYAKHTYENWMVSGVADYSGNEMEAAPRQIANTRLSYAPRAWRGGRVAVEWMHLGSYWEDPADTSKYEGHDVLTLRASYPITRSLEFFGHLFNVTDERFAERASYTAARGEELAPGMPRTVYAGIRYSWPARAANHPATTP